MERVVGTIFIPPADEDSLLKSFVEMAEQLLDHHTYLTDIRHPIEAADKPRKLVVSVRLED